MASLKEIKRLVDLCNTHELEGREILAAHTNTELASLYNGIGPESFPAWLRTFLDVIHPSLAPVALIHDVEWSASDGTRESFAASNARFRRNGSRIACALYPWYRPRRYAVMANAARFSHLCDRFGWAAWMAPFEAAKASK